MMKKMMLLGTAILAVSQLQAQRSPLRRLANEHPGARQIRSVMRSQHSQGLAQRPTALQQRVVAQKRSYFDDGVVISDSCAYRYSGVNGSRYDFNEVGYAEIFEARYEPMYNNHRYPYSSMFMLADSILNYDGEGLEILSVAFYRPDKKMDSSIYYSFEPGSTEILRSDFEYSSAGMLKYDRRYFSEDNGSTYQLVGYNSYEYDNSNTRVVRDSFVSLESALVWVNAYDYDAQGIMSSLVQYVHLPGVADSNRISFSYHPNGLLRTADFEYPSEDGAWQVNYRDSIGYDPTGQYYTYWLEEAFVYLNGTPIKSGVSLKRQFPGANGVPDSVLHYHWSPDLDDWVSEVRWEYEYNEFFNPVKLTSISNTETGQVVDGYYEFFYETYDDGLSATSVSKELSLDVYPNPFDQTIHIAWKAAAQPVDLQLINMLGQTVYSRTMNMQQGLNQIDVPGLSRGIYVLKLKAGDKSVLSYKLTR
jgi:hypothetical protein